MPPKRLNLLDVVRYYQNLTGQNKALKWLGESLTVEQVEGFYGSWYDNEVAINELPTTTTQDAFEIAYQFTRKWEGGYVDNPNDIGGATNFGVINSVYQDFRTQKGRQPQHVYYCTELEAKEVFYENYWLQGLCDKVPYPVNVALFDSVINFGVVGGTTFLQEVLQVRQDGVLGRESLQALKGRNTKDLALDMVAARITYRYKRVQELPSQGVFLDGWVNRDTDLEEFIISLCGNGEC